MTITQKSVVSLSIAGVAGLIAFGWTCANFVRDIRDEVRESARATSQGIENTNHSMDSLRSETKSAMATMGREIDSLRKEQAKQFSALWTVEDQVEFQWLFNEKNREKGIVIPTVREVRGPKGK